MRKGRGASLAIFLGKVNHLNALVDNVYAVYLSTGNEKL